MTTHLIPARLPLIAAPMAGGPSTPALVRAVTDAGAFGFLAAGYKSVEAMAEEIEQVRRGGTEFGVNLFVPSPDPVDEAAFAAYASELEAEAAAYDLTLDPVPRTDDDQWAAKIDHLLEHSVPVVSLVFGLPAGDEIAALRSRGTRVLATITSVAEARAARDCGVDGLVVQGDGAGGHSAIHDASALPEPLETAELVRRVGAAVDLPIVATGGVDGPGAVQRLLAAGAQAVAVGTLLLRTDEAGTSATHARALADPAFTETVLTRAFTGRPARALRNGFVDRHDATSIEAYPAVHHLTRALRQRAGAAGDADRLHLWAGSGWRHAPIGPVGEVVRRLAGE